jgi:hypothetical protein
MLLPMLLLSQAFAQVPVSTPTFGSTVSTERQGGSFGLGLAVGAPAGVTGKLWMGEWAGLQFTAGGDLGRLGDLAATVDYVIHFRPIDTGTDEFSIPIYIGGGLSGSWNWTEMQKGYVGPRLVTGFTLLVTAMPMDIYVEMAPTFYILEDLSWSIDGQLGARYYF